MSNDDLGCVKLCIPYGHNMHPPKNEPKEDPHISSKSEKVKGEKEEKRKRTMGDIKL